MEAGRHLYGGARQVLLLMQGLSRHGIRGTLICPPGSEMAPAARESDLPVQDMTMRGEIDAGFTWRLARQLRRLQPDLVHVHSRRGADIFGGLAARLAGIPAVLSRRVDSADWPGIGRLKYTPYRRVIAISACIRDRLATLGVPPAKLRLAYSAVAVPEASGRVSRQAFVDEFGMPSDIFPLAVVAQLIPRKGHRLLLEALLLLRETHPGFRVILFGTGPLKAELAARVTALKLDDQVRFAGYRANLSQWIGHFGLLVHPAEREGLGVAVLEAQAAGVPVVGFRAGGLAEAVADGETGLLVPPGDVEALADAIRLLIENDALRGRFAAAGRARIQHDFDVEAMVSGNLSVYREIAGQ